MRKLSLVLVMFVAMAAIALAQPMNADFNIIGSGARAHGMGGAFIGVADDASAVGWNPAGIAQLEKMEASAVGLFNMKKYHDEWSFGTNTGKIDASESHIAPAFASFALPLKVGERNLVAAVAFQRMVDLGSVSQRDSVHDVYGWYDYKDKMTGGIDAITPAFGFQISPMFSIGAAGNILINGYDEQFDKTYAGLNNSTDSYKHTYKMSGFNFNAGALLSTQKFNLGLMMRFPYTLTVKHSVTNNWDFTPNGGNTGSTSESDPEVTITMPLIIGFGVAVKPTDKLTLAADYELRPYTKSEVSQSGYSGNAGMHDCNQVRAGLEYVITGTNLVFPVRLGFRTDPKAMLMKWSGSFSNPDTAQAVGMVFTGGFGLIMGKVMLDLSYEYSQTTLYDLSEDFSGVTAEETSNEKTHTIMASCIFHF